MEGEVHIPEPYPGLRPFNKEEYAIFFGRRSQADAIIERLRKTYFAFVVGGSGSGKSSIINAAVIPRLRLRRIARSGDDWLTVTFTPKMQPMDNLVDALTGLLGAADFPPVKRYLLESNTIGKFLEDYGKFRKVDDQPLEDARGEANLLVICDQFEEIFRKENRSNPQSQQLIDLLLEAYRNREKYPRLYIIVSMRSEDLHRCAAFIDLPDVVNESLYLTRRLNENELAEAIVEPMRVVLGARDIKLVPYQPVSQNQWPFDVDLIGQILKAVKAISYDPDHLPLVQHLLFKLWRQAKAEGFLDQWRADASLRVTTGVLVRALEYTDWDHLESDKSEEKGSDSWILSKALDLAGEEALEPIKQDPKLMRIAEMMFRLLAELDDRGNYKRRWSSRQEIMEVTGASLDDVNKVVARFVSPYPFLVLQSGQKAEIDIAHESILRNWKRLVDWLGDERAIARQFDTLFNDYLERMDDAEAGDPRPVSEEKISETRKWRAERGDNPDWGLRYLREEGDGESDTKKTTRETDESQRDLYREVVGVYDSSKQEHEERRRRLVQKEQRTQRLRILAAVGVPLLAIGIILFFLGQRWSTWYGDEASAAETLRLKYGKLEQIEAQLVWDRSRASTAIIALNHIKEMRSWEATIWDRLVSVFDGDLKPRVSSAMDATQQTAANIVESYMYLQDTQFRRAVNAGEATCNLASSDSSRAISQARVLGDFLGYQGSAITVWGPYKPPIAAPFSVYAAFGTLEAGPYLQLFAVPVAQSELKGFDICALSAVVPLGQPIHEPPGTKIDVTGIDPSLRTFVWNSDKTRGGLYVVYKLNWFTNCPERTAKCLSYSYYYIQDNREPFSVGENSTLARPGASSAYSIDTSYEPTIVAEQDAQMVAEKFSKPESGELLVADKFSKPRGGELCDASDEYTAVLRDQDTRAPAIEIYRNANDAIACKPDAYKHRVASIPLPNWQVTDIRLDMSGPNGPMVLLRDGGELPIYYQVSWEHTAMLKSLCRIWNALSKELEGNPLGQGDGLSDADRIQTGEVCNAIHQG